MSAIVLLVATLAVHESVLTPLHTPADTRGLATGVGAVGHDAASLLADGPALQYRHRVLGDEGATRLGLYGLVPIDGLAFGVGAEWDDTPGAKLQRGVLALMAQPLRRLSLGLQYARLWSRHAELDGHVWSASARLEPNAWWALSVGVDGWNTPALFGGTLRPDYVAALALRPIVGAPWLSLAAEARYAAGTEAYDLYLGRAVISVAPAEGLHAFVAYGKTPNQVPLSQRSLALHEEASVWAGMSLALGGLETRVAIEAVRDRAQDAGQPFTDGALALTLQLGPSESVVPARGRTVGVDIEGNLIPEPGLLTSVPSVSVLPLQLDRLAEDATISSVRLNVGRLDVGLATVDELRAAVARLRAAGKNVVGVLGNADDQSYLVAAACNRIEIDPAATLEVDGFSLVGRYFAEALGKIGVRVESVEIGTHKTGPDALTRTRPRDAQRETTGALLDQAMHLLAMALQTDRGLRYDDVQRILAKGMFSAHEAIAYGLVDDLTVSSDPKAVPAEPPAAPAPDLARRTRRWGPDPVVAVVPVVGTIVMSASDNPLPGDSAEAARIVAMLRSARLDADVIGVVLRIDSPGGDVVASDVIWREVRRVAAVKPVVVSMADVAASGGYYVAAGADLILAQPDTVTGSIGIYSLKADLSGFYDWIGVFNATYRRGEHADWDGTEHPMRAADRVRVENNLRGYYDGFVAKVAEGRRLSLARAAELAQGRVYTGEQALALGLVDGLGGLADAVREIKVRSGLAEDADVAVRVPQQEVSLTGLLLQAASAGPGVVEPALARLATLAERLDAWEGRPLALMPAQERVLP